MLVDSTSGERSSSFIDLSTSDLCACIVATFTVGLRALLQKALAIDNEVLDWLDDELDVFLREHRR